ncbi:MAG: ATP-dependent 6-phosphofructokinase [candidate division KSB1 bacterium]|nr:ATP-dependent 6-phosphofructokinase [candidate division KSB1 bacterium]
MSTPKRIGILTGGGDCPGLNAVIRAVVKTAVKNYNMAVVGFLDGVEGLVDKRFINLTNDVVSGILTRGGTILGTSNRADPFRYPVLVDGKYEFRDRSDQALKTIDELGLEALVCIGGDGTMVVSQKLANRNVPIVGIPKTIDNDLVGTDVTFGFDSALTTATEAIDKIHTTAQSHHRVMVIEVMGRYAGWLALCSGIAGGGDIILIPEIPYDIDSVCNAIKERKYQGRYFSILVVGEGAKPKGGEMVVKKRIEGSPEPVRLGGISHKVADDIEDKIQVETRVTILGHLLRGGVPSPADRLLASRFGVCAAEQVAKRNFGQMVALRGSDIITVPIKDVAGKTRTVPLDHPYIAMARSLGTCLGD